MTPPPAYFLKLGTIGFGGPVALVEYMRRDLVERWSWISEKDYKDGLALSQLAPGPLAAQLAIYIGFVDFGVLGATAAGLAFVLPSFLMVMALGWAYVRFGGLPWMQAVFYGVGACVIGIIALSAYRLTRRSAGGGRPLLAIWLVAAVVTVIAESEEVLLFPGGGRPGRPGIATFVEGVTAAAIGALSGAVMVLGRRSIVDIPTAVLALATEPLIICAAALIGLLTFPR